MSRARFGCVAGIVSPGVTSGGPGQALSDLGGKPLIQRVVERTRAATLIDDVVVLASEDPDDDELVAYLATSGIPHRRVPSGDALGAYLGLVAEFEPRLVVRVRADRPFVDPDQLDLQLGALRAFGADLVRFVPADGADPSGVSGVPDGPCVSSARALRLAQASDDPRDRLHAGAFFLARHAADLIEVEIEGEPSPERAPLIVASPADLAGARILWAAVDHEGDGLFPLGRALRWVASHPDALGARVVDRAGARS